MLGPMTGSQFLATYLNRSQAEREDAAIQLVKEGNFVQWPLTPVPISSPTLQGTINVASDYFAVGTPDDPFYLPLSPIAAQRIADVLGLSLPTTKNVRDTWKAALQMQPFPMRNIWVGKRINPDTRMVTLQGFADHNAAIGRQPEGLISGTKKDVVISNKIRFDAPGKRGSVAIYGWFDKLGKFVQAGKPIQGLNPTDHDNGYADYSHGIRFVEPVVTLSTGEKVALTDPRIASLVTDEGVIRIARYNTGSQPPQTPPVSGNGGVQNVSLNDSNSESGAIGETERTSQKRGMGGLGWMLGLGVLGGVIWYGKRR